MKKLKEMSCIRLVNKMIKRYIPQETTSLGLRRQRLTIWYILLFTLGILSDLLEVSGSFDIFYKYTNSTMLILIGLWTTCYAARKTSILRTISLLAFTTQTLIAVDTIYCALTPTVPHTQMVILVNMLILTANIMFCIATYLGAATIVNVAISIITFIVCMLFTHSTDFQQYGIMVALIFIYIGILGIYIVRISQGLQQENDTIRQEDEELMNLLRLNKEQLRLYIRLAKKECNEDETRLILNQFNEKTQKYVIENVMKYVNAEQYTSKLIEKAFPELTPSERDIAQLILKGHKLGSICTMLNKTESNVNTQRANIRRKLGLQSSENLSDILHKRME